MRVDPRANLVILQARIAGPDLAIRISVGLDTGATYTTIPSDVARKLGFDMEDPERWVTVTGISGPERMPLVRVKAIAVLEQEVENCWVGIHDLPPEARVDGLLGLSFLRHLRLLLDMPSGYLGLEPSLRRKGP